jgi:hypothetical protein
MAKTKYTARLVGQVIGTRSSHRTYTHCVVVQKFDTNGETRGAPFVATWCGSAELARKASTSKQYVWPDTGYGSYRLVSIVPVEVEPSNARTAKAMNDSGVFAPLTAVGKD